MSTTATVMGRGIYSVAEAARLVRLEESRVRRWLRGYRYKSAGKQRWAPPLVGFYEGHGHEATTLSFADLIEILYLEHFSSAGVPTGVLRRATEAARAELQTNHPFGTNTFRTDGRWILQDLKRAGSPLLYNLVTSQLEPKKFLERMLRGELEFDVRQLVERWWPLSRRRDVVIDPQRRFGAPISASAGIPTETLFCTFRAERSYARTAWWYGVTERTVRDAVLFERQHAA